ncbi:MULTISPECIES: hypothetical protein [unclassified Streptomyces]|uniref:Uncharacterized protein n=1 Tax=Streptomyces sp. NBC_00060 TaxID=2975636 RepID=A0AAU2HBX6_9ACTN
MGTHEQGLSVTRIELTGVPQAVDRLMAALSAHGEIIYDSRSDLDARGEVHCIAEAVLPGEDAVPGAQGATTVTVQAVLDIDRAAGPSLLAAAGRGQLEADVAARLEGLSHSSGPARTRVVSVRPSRAPQD